MNLTPEAIKKYRKHVGLSQKQLGDWLGVNQATVCLWERGGKISGPAAILLTVLLRFNCHPNTLYFTGNLLHNFGVWLKHLKDDEIKIDNSDSESILP